MQQAPAYQLPAKVLVARLPIAEEPTARQLAVEVLAARLSTAEELEEQQLEEWAAQWLAERAEMDSPTRQLAEDVLRARLIEEFRPLLI